MLRRQPLIASRLDEAALAALAFCFPGIAVLLPLGVVPLLLAVALAAFAAGRLAGDPLPRPPRAIGLAAIAFAAWALASTLWALDPGQAAETWLRLVPTVVAGGYLVLHAAQQPEARRRRLAGWLLAGFAAAAAIMVFERLSGLAINLFLAGLVDQAPDDGRFHLNRLNRGAGALAILAWPAAAALAALLPARRRLWCLLLPLATVGLLSFFTSDAATLGCALALAVFLPALARPRGTHRLLRIGLAVALLAMPLGAVALSALGLAERDELDFSLRHRVFIWEFTVGKAVERPLLGWGLDSSRQLAGRDAPRFEAASEALPLHPHNAALQVAVELGAVGLLLGTALLLVVLARLRRAPPLTAALDAGMATVVLLMGLLAYGIWQLHWLAVPLAAAALMRALPAAARAQDSSVS